MADGIYIIIIIFLIICVCSVFIYFYFFSINQFQEILDLLSMSDSNCTFTVNNEEINKVINKKEYPFDINTETFGIIPNDFDEKITKYLITLLLIFTDSEDNKQAKAEGLEYPLSEMITYKNFDYIDHSIVRVYIDKYQRMYVTFRGTSRSNEIEQEIKVQQTEYYQTMVHLGFKNILSKIEDDLVEYIETQITENNIKEVYFIGHSMGGALLSIFISRLKTTSFFNTVGIYCITIGTPRSGNYPFESSTENKKRFGGLRIVENFIIINLINEMDLISYMIPPLIHIKDITYGYNFRGKIHQINFDYKCVQSNHSLITYFNNI